MDKPTQMREENGERVEAGGPFSLFTEITIQPTGGHNKVIIGKSQKRRDLPVLALSTFIKNLVVNLVVMATGDLRQLWVYHIAFSGIILPHVTMRIADTIKQPGGCMA